MKGVFVVELKDREGLRFLAASNVVSDEGIVDGVYRGLYGAGDAAAAPFLMELKFGERAMAADFVKNTIGAYHRKTGASVPLIERRTLFLKKRVKKVYALDDFVGAWGSIAVGPGFAVNPSLTAFGGESSGAYAAAFSAISQQNVWNAFAHDANHQRTVKDANGADPDLMADIFRNPNGVGTSNGKVYPGGAYAPDATAFRHQTFRMFVTTAGDASTGAYRLEVFPFPRIQKYGELFTQTTADSQTSPGYRKAFNEGSSYSDFHLLDGDILWWGASRIHLDTGWDDPDRELVPEMPVNPSTLADMKPSIGTPVKSNASHYYWPIRSQNEYNGLLKWDGTTFAFFNATTSPAIPVLSGDYIGSGYNNQSNFKFVEYDSASNVIWATGDNCGLLKFDLTANTFTRYAKVNSGDGPPSAPPSNGLNEFKIDSSGKLWIATDGVGLLRFDPSSAQFTQWTTAQGLANNNPTFVSIGVGDRVWFFPWNFTTQPRLHYIADGTTVSTITLDAAGGEVKYFGVHDSDVMAIYKLTGTNKWYEAFSYDATTFATGVDEINMFGLDGGNAVPSSVFHRGYFVFGQRLSQTTDFWRWAPVRKYGWTGSVWAKDSTSSKTMHLTDQSLVDGVTTRFANGDSAPHFVQDESFTFTAATGIVKDNTQEVTAGYDVYTADPLIVQNQGNTFGSISVLQLKDWALVGDSTTVSLTVADLLLTDMTGAQPIVVDGDTGVIESAARLAELGVLSSDTTDATAVDWNSSLGDTGWYAHLGQAALKGQYRTFLPTSGSWMMAHYIDLVFSSAVIDATTNDIHIDNISPLGAQRVPAAEDYFNGMELRVLNGANRGEKRTVLDYQLYNVVYGSPQSGSVPLQSYYARFVVDGTAFATGETVRIKLKTAGRIRADSSKASQTKNFSYIAVRR